jgi:hypothetical protein
MSQEGDHKCPRCGSNTVWLDNQHGHSFEGWPQCARVDPIQPTDRIAKQDWLSSGIEIGIPDRR